MGEGSLCWFVIAVSRRREHETKTRKTKPTSTRNVILPKSLEKYLKQYDLNNDGEVTEDEMKRATEIMELELREEKADAQKRMSWVSILSMVFFTAILFTPLIPESRVSALGDLLGLFYLGQASIVGFYFGAQAYMSRK